MANAIYFDGHSAADHPVTAMLQNDALYFDGSTTPSQRWSFAEMDAIDPYHAGRPFRITHRSQPGARLILNNEVLARDLIARAPQLKGGFNFKGAGKAASWIAGAIAAIGITGYLVLQLAPQQLAFVLPDSWRDRVGTQVEASLTEGARKCNGAQGISALGAMAARIAEGNPELPPLGISVYDVPVMNAFAMPGERIVITSELIRRATRPEQVAGVLAHEVGHVMKRHSEAQLVRATGLQILLSIVTGGGSDALASIAGVAAILTYTREAEAEADDVAIKLMTDAAIDPLGLKEFFEIILAEEGKSSSGGWGQFTSVLRTHPGTEDRIRKIQPLPDGILARPVMTDAQWEGLKKICG